MACANCGADDPFDMGGGVMACGGCGKRLPVGAAAGAYVFGRANVLPMKPASGIRIALIGHGTYNGMDGMFIVPPRVTLYFASEHGEPSTGAKPFGRNAEIEIKADQTLREGMICNQYRLWPMLGETRVNVDDIVPYHHAHRTPHREQLLQVGATVWMYSARSGDGPRLGSIVDRVLSLVQPGIAVEICWVPCREIPGVSVLEIARRMRFDAHADPIRYRNMPGGLTYGG